MILVDTPVWSLAFRRRKGERPQAPVVTLLQRLIAEDHPVTLPGIVLQEVLSGVRTPAEGRRLQTSLEGFPRLLATAHDHLEAAAIFSACRRAGVAAATVDCLIAAQCVTTGSVLLTTDADFDRMARYCPLRLLPVPST